MDEIPNIFKDSFSNLEKTIQTKHILEIVKEFELLLKEIILNENISCQTNCLIDITQPTEKEPKKIRVNIAIPDQKKPKIFFIIKYIIDYPEVLMNYMIEVTMLREYFGKNVKIVYILHDFNQKFLEESIYQTLIKNMLEQNYLDELLFLPKDFNKFLDLIKS
ncbi:MAG: hypothetical protein ACFFDN_50475 [Candidatus Hodarchaeota archaeon]